MDEHALNEEIKPHAQVLAEYISAESPSHWLADEVGEYLFSDTNDSAARSDVDREDAVSEVFERMDEEKSRLAEYAIEPHALLMCEIEVMKSETHAIASYFSRIVSPVLLLDICVRLCSVGDEVSVIHRYASGDVCDFSATWPFGMDWAVEATTPMGKVLAEQGDLSVDLDDAPRLPRYFAAGVSAAVTSILGGLVALLFFRRRRAG
jgi:hypothetical protein